MRLVTIGHGTGPIEALLECLEHAGVETLVDVRRFPGSRRNPQFNGRSLSESLAARRFGYLHLPELGGRLSGEPGEERFACIRTPAFRSYAARMSGASWQEALARALAQPAPCFMCAETLPSKCHRRLIADLLAARGHDVAHLIRPHEAHPHRYSEGAAVLDGRLYFCGEPVA